MADSMLRKQLRELKLSPDAPPSVEQWRDFLHAVRRGYAALAGRRALEPSGNLAAQARELHAKLQRSEDRFRAVSSLSSDWFWEIDKSYRFTEIVASFADLASVAHMIGKARWERPNATIVNDTWESHIAKLDRREPFYDVVYHHTSSNGKVRYLSTSGTPFFDNDGHFLGYRGVSRNVTDKILADQRMEHMANFDALTGLLNRGSMTQRLNMRLAAARDANRPLTVLFIDLDRFKGINDSFGHAAGDLVLRETAARLRANVRADDIIARLGGDEFLLVTSMTDLAAIQAWTKRLLAAINTPLFWQDRKFAISASIGISRFPDHALESETLLHRADAAMYHVKANGGNGATISGDESLRAPAQSPQSPQRRRKLQKSIS